MAMFPNATRGYMPFVSGQSSQKKSVSAAKKPSKTDHKRKTKGKTYQVTLRDKSGNTYSYVVRTDGTNSMPVLCSQMVNGVKSTDSLPNIGIDTRKILSSVNLPQDCKEDGAKKEGLFSSLVRFLKQKTGKSKSGKSKRKTKTLVMRKRQRTISAMSNLDPIQESPDEDEYYDDEEDADSYTHDSSSVSGSETSENLSIRETEGKIETETKKES